MDPRSDLLPPIGFELHCSLGGTHHSFEACFFMAQSQFLTCGNKLNLWLGKKSPQAKHLELRFFFFVQQPPL